MVGAKTKTYAGLNPKRVRTGIALEPVVIESIDRFVYITGHSTRSELINDCLKAHFPQFVSNLLAEVKVPSEIQKLFDLREALDQVESSQAKG